MLKVGGVHVGLAPAEKTESFLTPEVVEGSIHGNSVDPGTHFGFALKFCCVPKYTNKDILGNFFGILLPLGIAQRRVVDSIAK